MEVEQREASDGDKGMVRSYNYLAVVKITLNCPGSRWRECNMAWVARVTGLMAPENKGDLDLSSGPGGPEPSY